MVSVDSAQAGRSWVVFSGDDRVRLTYRALEDLLADLHHISPKSRIALQGRIKNFQRYGWPGGTNTGKGRAATYGFREIIRLCLGFEMLQLGVSPERAVSLLKNNWYNIRTAISLAVTAHPVLTIRTKKSSPMPEPFDVFLYCDPNALASLTDSIVDAADDTFFYTSSPQLARMLTEARQLDAQRLALINLTIVLDGIAQHLPAVQDFREAYTSWDDAEEDEADREFASAGTGRIDKG